MIRDIRESDLYREIEEQIRSLKKPGSGLIAEAREVDSAPDGLSAVFTAVLWDELEGSGQSRICNVNLESGERRMMTFGSIETLIICSRT